MGQTLTVDQGVYEQLRKAYADAVKAGKSRDDIVQAADRFFVVGYLRYALEYLELQGFKHKEGFK